MKTAIDSGTRIDLRSRWFDRQLLRAAKPVELRVEGATMFDIVVNVMTARALGLVRGDGQFSENLPRRRA
jgi:hypothetical protein